MARSVGKHFTYYGDCTVADRLIRINADLEDSILAETVLHEIGHALVELTGVRGLFKARQEETIVQALMHALTAVLQDNPSLLRLFRQN